MPQSKVREKIGIFKKLYVNSTEILGGLILGSGNAVDLNGETDALILDADADTIIDAPTDDTIDIKIAGADDFQFTANTFTALSGSTIATNTIAETTGAAGVTIDGALLKDRTSDLGRRSQELTSSGAITINSGLVLLNHATVAIDGTLDAPAVGDEFLIVNNSASGTAGHNIVLGSGVTWDGTNDTATFDAPGEALHVVAISATRFFILDNVGSVGLSSS